MTAIWIQVAIQVPSLAMVCWLVWKLGTLAITKFAEGDANRTKALVRGLGDITTLQREHGETLARIEGRLDERDALLTVVPNGVANGAR